MVLLTALFVFAFAAVTKNTAVKADAADGATTVADTGDIVIAPNQCPICREIFDSEEDYNSHVAACTGGSNPASGLYDLSITDIVRTFVELTEEEGRDEKTEALLNNAEMVLKGYVISKDSFEWDYVLERYKDDPICTDLILTLKKKLNSFYAGYKEVVSENLSTTRHRPSITEPWSGSYYESSDGVFTFIIRDDYALVSRCRRDVTGTAEIPSTVEGKPVTAIGENAFNECSLNEIIIPEGVVYIGRGAFSYSNVEIVHLPNSLDEIGEDAFYSCNQLTQITLPDGLEYIGESAFCNCRKLESVRIPKTVKNIGYYAFDCYNYYYQENCGIKSIEVDPENKVYASENDVLFDKAMIELIKYPSGKKDKSYAVPEGVVTISGRAFNYCPEISSITLPQSVAYIGSYAFDECIKLIEIDLPKGVETIGEGAFKGCRELESIVIPDGVISINDATFINCYRLSSVVLPSGIVEIGDNAFEDCHSLNQISLPDDLIVIGKWAFYNTGLSQLTLPKGLIAIGDSAFRNCNISALKVPDSVDYIGSGAFAECSWLVKAELPDGFSLINSETFLWCERLTEIILPDSIKMVGDSAFSNCVSLTDVNYKGTQDQWNKVVIKDNNKPLLDAAMHYKYHEHRLKTKTIPATCTADGEEYNVCEICGNTIGNVKVLKATGHSWQDDFTVDKEATCTETGVKSVHCNNCSATRYSTDIAKKEHTPVEDAAVAATCTEDGLTAGSHCSKCGTVITAQKIVNATGHKYTSQTTDATCTAAGKTVYTCSVCRNSYSETIPAKGHEDKNNDGICDICGLRIKPISNIRLTLRIEPSATINYGETAVIYVTNTDLPAGTQLVWTISGNGVNITPSADGMSCTVKSTDNGTATVTVTAYDANGNILKSDTGRIISASQAIISKASFIQKVAAFFRNLFGKKSLVSLVKKEFYIKAK